MFSVSLLRVGDKFCVFIEFMFFNFLFILFYSYKCEKYCDIPYCRIHRDAPPITATPSSLSKRR